MKSIEKGLLDKFFNGYILKKRGISKPFRYITDQPYFISRFTDMIMFPKNKLEKAISYSYERMLPTIAYCSWKPLMEGARMSGWTTQERFYFNFFRSNNYNYHVLGQHFHPYGYLERQRADQFIRRVETIMPGIEAPDWAQNSRRVPDFDHASVDMWWDALQSFHRESTPKPHSNVPNYFAIGHYYNQRFQLGKWAQRLFYNEEVKGDFLNTGYYSKVDHEIMDSWYGNTDHILQKIEKMTPEQKQELHKNAEKWEKLIHEFYPEFRNVKVDPITHKYQEPYFERNLEDIRNSIWAEKILRAQEKNTFSNQEWSGVMEFFSEGRDELFWTQNEETGQYTPTNLYLKLVNELDLPNIFELDKFTGRNLEEQYNNALDRKWGINFHTVDTYRNRVSDLLENNYLKTNSSKMNNKQYSALRQLVIEEVYNPFFKSQISKKYGKSDNAKQSLVLNAIEGSKADHTSFDQLVSESRESLNWLLSREAKTQFQHRVRQVVKTFIFKPQVVLKR